MPPTLPITPHCYAGASLTLPPWQATDASGAPATPTAIAFTIKRVPDRSVVGAAARDGLGSGSGANGVSLNAAGVLVHTIGVADNTLLVAGASEARWVEYTLTFADGGVVEVLVEFWLRSLEY